MISSIDVDFGGGQKDLLEDLPERVESLFEDFPQLEFSEVFTIALLAEFSDKCKNIKGQSSKNDGGLRLLQDCLLCGIDQAFEATEKFDSKLTDEQRGWIAYWIGWELRGAKICRMRSAKKGGSK